MQKRSNKPTVKKTVKGVKMKKLPTVARKKMIPPTPRVSAKNIAKKKRQLQTKKVKSPKPIKKEVPKKIVKKEVKKPTSKPQKKPEKLKAKVVLKTKIKSKPKPLVKKEKSKPKQPRPKQEAAKPPVKIKEEPLSDNEIIVPVPPLQPKIEETTKKPVKRKLPVQTKVPLVKKRLLPQKEINKRNAEKMTRKMKLYSFWNGPKRHRVASLNAIAKVHCLYENESRSNLLDQIEMIKKEPHTEKKSQARTPSPPVIKVEPDSPPPTRILRCVPGLRAVGKMWDYTTSSSDEVESEPERPVRPRPKPKKPKPKPTPVVQTEVKEEPAVKEVKEKKPVKRRKRAEIVMDLKDMVVRKRMASLNATAILAASYSVEKRGPKGIDSDSDTETSSSEEYFSSDDGKKCYEDDIKKEEDRKLIEVRATPNKKVAVILNQDTDVTITGVYVNSTRSTHHEGYCSIAGMQYRISATSHTQTAATAVATETILQSASTSSGQDSTNGDSTPTKSYTPLDALSNMQPPAGGGGGGTAGTGGGAGQHGVPLPHHHHHLPPPPPPPHGGELSPIPRRHGCTSAFSPPCGSQGHHHLPGDHGYMPGYYQPAGPLITVPHGHSQPPPVGKAVPLSDPSPSLSPPVVQTQHQQQSPPPPSSAGDSSDSEVIITSVTSAKEAAAAAANQPQQPPPPPSSQQYRFSHYPPAHSTYPYGYPPQYYSGPPPASAYSHHEMCYPPYSQHKYMFRRYLPPPPPAAQYYQPGSPSDLYSQPHNSQNSSSQQVVTATSTASGATYPPAPAGPPPPTIIDTYPQPPPTLVETFPPPPPHFYHGYGHAPPPPCYTHSPPSRSMNYINATYQSCPCPIQSCPKNVHTGPLTGDSKRSNISIAKESVPLPPVALALPLEPASATGPPSPARGSAGMPPPPSPAGATYQPPPPKQETPEPPDLKHAEKRRKARVGKAMVRNTIAANQNTMLLMCHAPSQNTYLDNVKREVESPQDTESKKQDEPPIITQEEHVELRKETLEEINDEPPQLEPEVPPLKIEVDKTPVLKTVAENVKVKNMKRKLSTSEPAIAETPIKRLKVDPKTNGSYKDLIKKTQNAIRINNGKRKLIVGERKFARIKLKRRRLAMAKELRKSSKQPLTASNLHNAKQNVTEMTPAVVEKKVCSRKASASVAKKPAILDNLLPKSNVDRTIESVISGRTNRLHEEEEKCCKRDPKKSGVAKGKVAKVETTVTTTTTTKVIGKRKNSRCKEVPQVVAKVPRRSLQLRWSNGWMWEGEPFDGKVFLNSDETIVNRKCFPSMRHEEGDLIEPRDCVLLKAGQRKNELPFVAKIAALWENPDDGEMMMSLLWYYRPEHTEQGRLASDQPDEVFASRHKDSNSVACIEDKCYVLTFNEYCRYRKNLRRLEEGLEDAGPCIPAPDLYPRTHRQPPKSVLTSPEMVFFCRRVYDFRQKRIVKNPS